MSEGGRLDVVRDHENRLIEALVQVAQYVEDRQGITRIEVSGGLVCQQDTWLC